MTGTIFTKKHIGTNGAPTLIVATATPGTGVYTATNVAGEIDEIWLYVNNTDIGTDHTVTFEWGSAADKLVVEVLAQSTLLVSPGFILSGGLAISAFADAANAVEVYGFVNNIKDNT